MLWFFLITYNTNYNTAQKLLPSPGFPLHIGSPVRLSMIFLFHVALSISSPTLSPALFMTCWHASFHLMFGHLLFFGTKMQKLLRCQNLEETRALWRIKTQAFGNVVFVWNSKSLSLSLSIYIYIYIYISTYLSLSLLCFCIPSVPPSYSPVSLLLTPFILHTYANLQCVKRTSHQYQLVVTFQSLYRF